MPKDTGRLHGVLERLKGSTQVARRRTGPYTDVYIAHYGATEYYLLYTYDARTGLLWPRTRGMLEDMEMAAEREGARYGVDMGEHWQLVDALPERRHIP